MRWHTRRITFVTNKKKGNGWKRGQERGTLSSQVKHWIEDEIYSVWETVIKDLVPIGRTSWFSDPSLSAFFRLRELSDLFCFVFLLPEVLEFGFGHLWYSCHIVSVHKQQYYNFEIVVFVEDRKYSCATTLWYNKKNLHWIITLQILLSDLKQVLDCLSFFICKMTGLIKGFLGSLSTHKFWIYDFFTQLMTLKKKN